MNNQRDSYYDVIKGIAIIMVIGIHTFTNDNYNISLYVRPYLNCAVPIFLALSGFFIGSKPLKTREAYASFLIKQIKRVYVPMLIWSIPWICMEIENGIMRKSSLLLLWVIGGLDIMYFVTLIIQFYILTPVFQRITKSLLSLIILMLLTLSSVHLINNYVHENSLVFSLGLAPFWLVFYYLGVVQAQGKMFRLRMSILLVLILISIVCIGIETYISLRYSVNQGYKSSTHIFSIFVIILVFHPSVKKCFQKIDKQPFVKMLSLVGRWSFFLYLTHCLSLHLIYPDFFLNVWPIDWFVVSVLALFFCYMTSKIIPQKCHRYIGF